MIVWGNFFAHVGRVKRACNLLNLADTGITIVSLETPLIGREHFEQCDRIEPFLRVGFWNTSTLHRGGFNIPAEATDDRLNAVLRETGTEYTRTRNFGDAVLYCLQTSGDTSLQGTDVETAAIYDLVHLQRVTDRHVIVVKHPYDTKGISDLTTFCSMRSIAIVDGPLTDWIHRGFCTVSHSSSAAIDGILHGVPAVTLNAGSFARPCSVHSIADLESATLDGCHEWLCRVVFSQWKESEFEDALKHLKIR